MLAEAAAVPDVSERQHETVGRLFKGMGAIWYCFRWERRAGFQCTREESNLHGRSGRFTAG